MKPGTQRDAMDQFRPRSSEDVARLVDENPLAWIFLQDPEGPFATAAPVRPGGTEGQLTKLIGHVPRSGRMAACLKSPCEALLLFLGPHGYISPSWMSDRTQAPTWNFTSAQFVAEIELVDDPAFLERHLRDLTSAMERARARAWHIDEMGDRMQKLAARIIAFEARIICTQARFKLGQDESDQTYPEIVSGLELDSHSRLLQWMHRFNPDRS
ncbi:MAG TPA: FMN-binding negative transcriptional regulator [Woeseiaceae bacterium]|nr:FMN-binding negative transcriptional regulator [Woeseiaceae bacterium]